MRAAGYRAGHGWRSPDHRHRRPRCPGRGSRNSRSRSSAIRGGKGCATRLRFRRLLDVFRAQPRTRDSSPRHATQEDRASGVVRPQPQFRTRRTTPCPDGAAQRQAHLADPGTRRHRHLPDGRARNPRSGHGGQGRRLADRRRNGPRDTGRDDPLGPCRQCHRSAPSLGPRRGLHLGHWRHHHRYRAGAWRPAATGSGRCPGRWLSHHGARGGLVHLGVGRRQRDSPRRSGASHGRAATRGPPGPPGVASSEGRGIPRTTDRASLAGGVGCGIRPAPAPARYGTGGPFPSPAGAVGSAVRGARTNGGPLPGPFAQTVAGGPVGSQSHHHVTIHAERCRPCSGHPRFLERAGLGACGAALAAMVGHERARSARRPSGFSRALW